MKKRTVVDSMFVCIVCIQISQLNLVPVSKLK